MRTINGALTITRPAAILLDLDNTLYDYQGPHQAASHAAVQQAHAATGISEGVFNEALDLAKATVKARLKNTASSHSRILYFKETLEVLGLGSQALLTLELEQVYWRVFLDKIELFSGVLGFLDDIRIAGIPVAIVTDLTTQVQLKKIAFLGLEKYVDAMVTSEEAGVEKPSQEPFLLALKKLELEPRNLWFIGDDYQKDIEGSKIHLNAVTFHKTTRARSRLEDETLTDFQFQEFSTFRTFLASSLGASK